MEILFAGLMVLSVIRYLNIREYERQADEVMKPLPMPFTHEQLDEQWSKKNEILRDRDRYGGYLWVAWVVAFISWMLQEGYLP